MITFTPLQDPNLWALFSSTSAAGLAKDHPMTPFICRLLLYPMQRVK